MKMSLKAESLPISTPSWSLPAQGHASVVILIGADVETYCFTGSVPETLHLSSLFV